MPFYLKTDENYLPAEKPKLIYPGRCEGQLEILPLKGNWEIYIKNHVNTPGKNQRKRIFICSTLKTSLRPLIPFAHGFIFKEGSNLHHFANILRHHNIPACIDRSLWFQAIKTMKHQNRIIHAELCCGEKHRYTRDTIENYGRNFQFFSHKIRDNPLTVSIYDMKNKKFLQGHECVSLPPGQKTLSINALFAEGCLVPGTLVLSNFKDISTEDITCDSFYNAITLRFPRFGEDPGFSLMVRASLQSYPAYQVPMSGVIHSSSVQRENELIELIKRNVSLWKNIPSSNGISLTIIIQELIPAFILGIVFTCLPWDYHSNKMIFDLTFPGSGKEPDIKIQGSTIDYHPGQRKIQVHEQLTSRLGPGLPPNLNNKQFYPAFSNFLKQCHRLHTVYMIPLDIEFVVTNDLVFYFVQFRHIFYPETM
ncbi:MAG: hypothetical protein JXB88_19270 [Spirochaetales bacterium]|nr:hypothetical protein [Spirochaetales bacterium]